MILTLKSEWFYPGDIFYWTLLFFFSSFQPISLAASRMIGQCSKTMWGLKTHQRKPRTMKMSTGRACDEDTLPDIASTTDSVSSSELSKELLIECFTHEIPLWAAMQAIKWYCDYKLTVFCCWQWGRWLYSWVYGRQVKLHWEFLSSPLLIEIDSFRSSKHKLPKTTKQMMMQLSLWRAGDTVDTDVGRTAFLLTVRLLFPPARLCGHHTVMGCLFKTFHIYFRDMASLQFPHWLHFWLKPFLWLPCSHLGPA